MSIPIEEVKKIHNLAKIGATDEKLASTAEKLQSVLQFVEQINAADTEGVEPLSHALDHTQPERQDTAHTDIPREDIQKSTSHVEKGLYLVPKVIE